MTATLGTAAYKLVLDAREFGANAVQSGKHMKEVQQVMRQTTTPAEKMAKSYDSVTEAYQKGQMPLKNYERYLSQLNTAAVGNSKAVKNMVQQYAGGMPVIGRYVNMLGKIPPAAIAAAAAIGGIAVAMKGAQVYFRKLNETFRDIDAVAKRSKATGFDPTSMLGVERGAALVAGVDEKTTEKSLAMFVRRLGEVKMGSGEAKRALDLLGLSADDLADMAPIEALKLVSDRFQDVETIAEKASVAQMLFGRSGQQLVPFLDQGSDAMAKFVQYIEDMNQGFSLEEAANVERYNDAVTQLGAAWKGVWTQLAIQAAPELADAAEKFKDAMTDPGMQKAISTMAQDIGSITGAMAELTTHAGVLSEFRDVMDWTGVGPRGVMGPVGKVQGLYSWLTGGADEAEQQVAATADAMAASLVDLDATSEETIPAWVRRWENAEDALKGTSKALEELTHAQEDYNRQLKAEQEIARAEEMWGKLIGEDKLKQAQEQWAAFEQGVTEREISRVERMLSGLGGMSVSADVQGVEFGSQEMIRDLNRTQQQQGWTPQRIEAMLQHMDDTAENTRAMAEQIVVSRVAEPV